MMTGAIEFFCMKASAGFTDPRKGVTAAAAAPPWITSLRSTLMCTEGVKAAAEPARAATMTDFDSIAERETRGQNLGFPDYYCQ